MTYIRTNIGKHLKGLKGHDTNSMKDCNDNKFK